MAYTADTPTPCPRAARHGWVILQVIVGAIVVAVAAAGPEPTRLWRTRRATASSRGGGSGVVIVRDATWGSISCFRAGARTPTASPAASTAASDT